MCRRWNIAISTVVTWAAINFCGEQLPHAAALPIVPTPWQASIQSETSYKWETE